MILSQIIQMGEIFVLAYTHAFKDSCGIQSESPLEGDLLVVRRLLGQVLQPFDESQRENIVRIYGFKLEGGELFKEGFCKLLSLE